MFVATNSWTEEESPPIRRLAPPEMVVAAPLRGSSRNGPGNHVSGAAQRPAPRNRGEIPVRHRKGKKMFVFIASALGFSVTETDAPILPDEWQLPKAYADWRRCQVPLTRTECISIPPPYREPSSARSSHQSGWTL